MGTEKKILLLLAAGMCLSPRAALADDDEIFTVQAVQPNVVILIDTSGSMEDRVNDEKKITSAKRVVTDLLNSVDGVRFGIFKFNQNENGGELVAPVGATKADMLDAVADMTTNGSTPLGRATQNVQDYYLGRYTEVRETSYWGGGSSGWSGGGGAWSSSGGGASTASGGTSSGGSSRFGGAGSAGGHGSGGGGSSANWGGGGGDDDDDDDDGGSGGSTTETITYPSPIEYECQKNYAILITDGLPNGEPEDQVTDVAADMFAIDHSSVLDLKQNVITHTVGFDIPAGATLLRATATAGGGSFYTANNEAQLRRALQDAISQIVEDTYAFAAPLVPSTSVVGGSNAYVASFRPDPTRPVWKGYLSAYERGTDGKIPLDAEGMPDAAERVWEAGSLLAARAASDRTIHTVKNGALVAFTNANVTRQMLGVSTDTIRDKVINFVRGIDSYDEDLDTNVAEARSWKLGDIFHSTPVLVYPPPLLSSDSSYQTFKQTNGSRTTIVLVGANDGMLHAFRASDGVESWAVIPADMLTRLQLMTPAVASHEFYVDATPVVADVKLSGTWKTIALFGTRRGGRSYHALDITNTTAPTYLWSYTDTEMGETWSKPVIGKIALADGTEKYVAFVGGGYNTTTNNGTGRAFYVIDLSNGQTLWKYATGGTADKQHMNFSLPAAPTVVDLDRDGFADRVYLSDVGGQIWKFDVSADATVSSGLVTNWTGKRLFAADPTQTNPPAAGAYAPDQGMYAPVAVARDDEGAVWVLIGTGDRNRPESDSQNYFFAIKDDTSMTNGSTLDPTDLVDATSGADVTQGWYYELDANEKVLSGAMVFNNIVHFSTYDPVSADVCDNATGDARLYALQMATGDPGFDWANKKPLASPTGSEERSTVVGSGIPTEPTVALGSSEDSIVVGTTDEEVTEVTMPSSTTKRVRYWREVY